MVCFRSIRRTLSIEIWSQRTSSSTNRSRLMAGTQQTYQSDTRPRSPTSASRLRFIQMSSTGRTTSMRWWARYCSWHQNKRLVRGMAKESICGPWALWFSRCLLASTHSIRLEIQRRAILKEYPNRTLTKPCRIASRSTTWARKRNRSWKGCLLEESQIDTE